MILGLCRGNRRNPGGGCSMLESLNIPCTNFHEFSTTRWLVVDLVGDREYSFIERAAVKCKDKVVLFLV
jgi:hypothetical protein